MSRISEIIGNHSLYVTRTWSFHPQDWAVVSFTEEGSVDNWIDRMEGNIYVLCFASHITNEHISKENQGRVFGIYEAIPKKMYYTDEGAIQKHLYKKPSPHALNKKGEFRWPWGLEATRAWKFTGQDIFTAQTLPDSRALGLEISSNIRPISDRDYNLLNQPSYQLEEVEVYMKPPPQILTNPNARPDSNYLFLCQNEEILKRIPNWEKGEVLAKPGISSNVSERLNTINNHPISRIFQIQFEKMWSAPSYSEKQARRIEKMMIEKAQNIGRLATKGQEEYFFIPKGDWSRLINAAGGVTKVS